MTTDKSHSQSLALSFLSLPPPKHTCAFECGAGCCSGTNRSSWPATSRRPRGDSSSDCVMVWRVSYTVCLRSCPLPDFRLARRGKSLDHGVIQFHTIYSTYIVQLHAILPHLPTPEMEAFLDKQSKEYQRHCAIRNKARRVLQLQNNIRAFKTIPKQYSPQRYLQLVQPTPTLTQEFHEKYKELFFEH